MPTGPWVNPALIEGIARRNTLCQYRQRLGVATPAAIRTLAARSDVQLVGAKDGNPRGDSDAAWLRALMEDVGYAWLRMRPHGELKRSAETVGEISG